ncbi:hypothetical protein ACWC09_47145 [Streptomyces sp. NPDC001617]
MASKRRTSGKNKTRRTRHPSTPAQAAAEYERLVEQYPEDREELLREAADAWRSAGQHDRALAVYGQLLDPESDGCRERDVVDAWRIDTLWEAGRQEEARTAAATFRARHPRDATAWSLVAGAFEYADETATAAYDGRHAGTRCRCRGDGGRGRRLPGLVRAGGTPHRPPPSAAPARRDPRRLGRRGRRSAREARFARTRPGASAGRAPTTRSA